MSKDPEIKETKAEEAEEPVDPTIVLTNIPGVGPKTGEKLVEAGFDSLAKVIEASDEDLASNVQGLSVAKAEVVIEAAKNLQEKIDSGELDITGKAKKSKRKKAQEPDPELHELPPAEVLEEALQRTKLETVLEKERKGMGVFVGPKWLTRFERARIIGARALQISMGAPVLVDMKKAPKGLFALAETELKAGVLPMTVRRTLPTGESHDITLTLLLKNTRLD